MPDSGDMITNSKVCLGTMVLTESGVKSSIRVSRKRLTQPNGKRGETMANVQMQAVMQQVNDLELKYRVKQETFWQRMFMGCTGFVAVVVRLSLRVNMPSSARICLVISVLIHWLLESLSFKFHK